MKKRVLATLVSTALILQVLTVFNFGPNVVYASTSSKTSNKKYSKNSSTKSHIRKPEKKSQKSKLNDALLPMEVLLDESDEPEAKLPKRSIKRSENSERKYSFDELNSMNYETLINTLVTIQWEQIPGLFEKSAGSTQFFGNKDRVQAIINALYTKGSQFTENDDKGIPTLVEVLRAGYYLGFHNSELSYLNKRENKDKCIPALKQIVANPKFALGTKTQDGVVNSVGALIGNASSDSELLASLTTVMAQFNRNLVENCKTESKSKAIYSILRGVEYDLGSYIRYENKGVDPLKTKWGGKIDGFINEIEKIALETQINENTGWLINNGIFSIATVGKFHSNPKKGVEVLTNAFKSHKYIGEQFFEAVNGINNEYKGIDADGNKLDMHKIKQDGENKYYPNVYKFDNNKIIIKAGKGVTEEKIKRLYWASKEVSAQYFRNIGRDQSLEENHVDEVLTIIIYSNPREYKMNYALNGIGTDNGGMYIEEEGTFYTYERNAEESRYTLEELFRHEFTHYLQGRYLVPGLWQNSTIHDNERLTWYEEGEAEFYAGSTRTEGIKTRKSMVSSLMEVPASERYSVEKALKSSYNDGFGFYPYVCYLINYLSEHDFDKYTKLKDYLIKNDSKGFDQYVQTLKRDSHFNQKYQEFMEKLYNDYDKLTIPLVSDDYIKPHSNKSLDEVKRDIQSLSGITDVKATQKRSQFFNTFEVKGTYTGEYYAGKLIDMQKMKEVANNCLKELDKKGWSGYKTTTSYFVNWRLDQNYHYQFDIVFRGYLSDNGGVEPAKPVVQINGPYQGESGKFIQFSSKGSKTENGNIEKYQWNFGDNVTSNEKNPTHAYKRKGEYTVTLKIIDEMGMEDVKTAKVTVKESSTPLANEVEPNDDFENANGPIFNKVSVKGSVTNGNEDFFYFNLDEKAKVKISLDKLKNNKLTYLLYKESDLEKHISYPKNLNGNLGSSEEILEPGKYYILVYAGDSKEGNYDLTWEKIQSN